MERTIEKVDFGLAKQPKAKRVAAYARVSSGKDAMLQSLSAQVSYYNKMIQSHPGWLYCGVYADEAITGTKDNRDDFQRMLSDCRNRKLDLIITKSISRFARNTVTLLETVRELKLLDVEVFFEEQNIYTMSAEGELMMTILASYAQEESLSVSENQKWKVKQAFQNGELFNLRFMFGYNITKGKVEVNPDEAEIVREIFQRVIDGESFTSICRDLNKRKIPRANGGRWYDMRIREMLANEKYTGNALLMKHYRNNHLEKKKTKNKGELPMYYAEDTHEAIIDMDTFEKAQTVLRRLEQEASKRSKPKKSQFTSLIQCENCGANYKRCTSKGTIFWDCRTNMLYGKSLCAGGRIHEDMLYEITAGVADFNKIRQITAKDNILTFFLDDGSQVKREWQLKPRSESWTYEIKEAARQRAQQQRRREYGANSNSRTSNS